MLRKGIRLLLCCFLSAGILPGCSLFLQRQVPTNVDNLSSLLLIFSPSSQNAEFKRQIDSLSLYQDEIRLRQLRIYKVFPDHGLNHDNRSLVQAQIYDLRERFNVAPQAFTMVLLRPDGQEAARKSDWWNPVELFSKLNTKGTR